MLIKTTEGFTYEPKIFDDGRVGYRIKHPNGSVSWMYLNPSTESDDAKPNVFLYVGDTPHIEDGISETWIYPYGVE